MASSLPLRFLIVDDHALFRMGMSLVAHEVMGGAEVLEAISIEDALQQAVSPRLDLIVLDVHLPDADGLDAIGALHQRFGPVPVLMVSSSDTPELIARAQARGATGFVSKLAQPARLTEALRSCLQGQPFFPSARAHSTARWAEAPEATALEAAEGGQGPSARQLSILRMVGEGVANQVIAQHMCLSEEEVRAEVSWLTEMLDARSREQAYEQAVQRGWLVAL